MKDLLAKLEAATEGSIELDRMIAVHVGRKLTAEIFHEELGYSQTIPKGIPMYTRSLDSAMRLLAPKWYFELRSRAGRALYSATVEIEADSGMNYASAPTAPLALCIAALRARGETA